MKGGLVPKLSGIYSSKFPSAVQQNDLNHLSSLLPSDFPIDKQHYAEQIDKRTLTSRTFIGDDGEVVIKYGAKNLNYLDKEKKLQPIDATLHSYNTGWAALQQESPTYLNSDASTEFSSNENKIKFNSNCRINGNVLDLSDYTVGEDGMYVNNVAPNVDKKIIFNENRIETDYIINHPMVSSGDLVISEEIGLPEGYVIKKEKITGNGNFNSSAEEYVVYSADNKEQARFKTPVFYDANKKMIVGKYNLTEQQGKFVLQFTVPGNWLNKPDRVYPITIDPVVTGPISNYPAVYLGSCVMPAYESDSMIVTIPADITITNFFVTDSYYADAIAGCFYSQGSMYLTSPCGSTPNYTVASPAGDSSGYAYLNHADLKSFLACCFTPSCAIQTFHLAHHIGRTAAYGPGCNQAFIYYSPFSPYPFTAYIVGRTVETTQGQWSVLPTTVCSDSCRIILKATTDYGVPPYTMTHPWAVGSVTYGTSIGSCTSSGTATIPLSIPGCPTTCGITQTLSVPPPVIIDVCGIAVAGLSPKNITINPVPIAFATAEPVCSGTPIDILVTSCVAGSSVVWTGSDGKNGTGNITDSVVNSGTTPITINYSVTPTANGCVGQPLVVSEIISPDPVIYAGRDTTVQKGNSVQLNGSGGTTYVWTPNTGLTCSTCPNPMATPDQTTTYYLSGINGFGCMNRDTVIVNVIQGDDELYIPNSFTPNGNGLNDLFFVFGSNIMNINIQIYDRWGELVYHGTDQYKGWDGKFHGHAVEEGVYVYKVDCQFFSTNWAHRTGIVTVLINPD